jgi:prepilin-type processing-associated H-X9-DG protein
MRDAAEKHPEKLLPRLSAVPGRLMHEFTDVYKPGWGESPSPYIASRDPKYRRYEEGMDFKATVDDGSFFYLGYEVANDAEMAVFAAAYRAAAASGRGFDRDFESTPENGGAGAFRLHRLNLRPPAPPAELKRPPLPKILGQGVPVLIERIRNNKGKGGHVLYLDGHVEFIDYPGRWPMTPKTVALLDELDRMGDDGHAAR